MSEGIYRQLLRDPRRDASEFARASLTYGAELLASNPKRSEEVFSLALDTLHLPLEPHEAELASRLAGSLVEVSYELDRPDKRLRAIRVEQELIANGLIPVAPGHSSLLRCLAASALVDLEQWPDAVLELSAAVAESAQMPSDEMFARVVSEVVLATRAGKLGSANVSVLDQNLSVVRQQSLDGERTIGCLVGLAAVRLAVGDTTSAQLYERRILAITSADELDVVSKLVLSWIDLERDEFNRALAQLTSIPLPELDRANVRIGISDLTRLDPSRDPRLWAEVILAEGETYLKIGDEARGTALLRAVLEHPVLGAAGRARAHEELARVAALAGNHDEAYQHLVVTRETEARRSQEIARRLSSHRFQIGNSDQALLDLPLPDDHEDLEEQAPNELNVAPEPHEVSEPEQVVNLTDDSAGAEIDLAAVDAVNVDPMTGLANRQRLRAELVRLAESSKSMMILVFDIDRLGRLNESVGHEFGDRFLVEVARRLSDPGLSHAVVARWGGDEFVVAIGEIRTLNNAVITANEIRDHLCAAWEPDSPGTRIVPSITMGMSLTLDRKLDPDILLRNADTALQRAKATNKGGIEIFGAHLSADAQYRFETEYLLRDALENEWFELFFQPLYSNATGRPYAAEALVRLNHPELGILAPGTFLPVAEETGLSRPIGLWVIDGACRAAAIYRQFDPDVVVTVNVSSSQLTDDFPDLVASSMARHGVRGESLIVELTEHTLLAADETQVAALRRLHRLGIRIALDDFGTKYSSFEHLRRFPIDVVKIDQTFVAGICENPEDAAIVKAVVGLSTAFNFMVVAEGVETAEQLDMQRQLGCDAAQGFLIGRPAPMSDFADLLAGLSIFDGAAINLLKLSQPELTQPDWS